MAKKDAKSRNLSGRNRLHDVTADGGASFKEIAKAIGTTEPGAIFIYKRAMKKLRKFLQFTKLGRELRSHLRREI